MQLAEYMDKIDYKMIRFSFMLISEIEQKLKNKTFFYKNQILTYINDQVERFLSSLQVRCSLVKVYKTEIYKLIKPRLNKIYQKHKLYYCI
ncbi:hypothetical protein [Metabacillus malikii]|uniref:Uncharacterized protein n=1 Tax=Metabacillus malikii TaxID=1504265 RepID=A0ABT9ZAD4_9BACI|nr:hypothetical protein [Metabacillus malikii]MDQ0228904.1 hypothetical protein [Metabacillus malikii]